MPISAIDAISPAFQHSRKQLFEPFRFSQWWRLGLVGLLAGEMGSGGSFNGNFNWPSTPRHQGSEQFLATAWPKVLGDHPLIVSGLITFMVVAGIGLIILFTYVGSVMRFILFDSIVSKECHIRQGWARRRREGRVLFLWQMALLVLSLVAMVILIGIPASFAWGLGWFKHPHEHMLPLILGGSVLFLELLALVVGFSVVHVMTKDFVVPQMALENVTAFEGWNRLWRAVRAEKSGYALYIGMKIGLAIAASMATALISLIVILVLVFTVGGIGVGIVMAAKAAGATWNMQTITLAVVAALIVLAILLFALSLISVPVIVFFPAYSIYFLAARYPALAAVIWPPLPGSVAPVQSGLA